MDLCLTVVHVFLLISHYLSVQRTLDGLSLHLVHALLKTSTLIGFFRAKVLGKDFSMLTLHEFFSEILHVHLLFQNSL